MSEFCPACGSSLTMTPFDSEMSEILYGDLAAEVSDLQGERCSECGEIEYGPDSALRYAAAGDALVVEARLSKAGGTSLSLASDG